MSVRHPVTIVAAGAFLVLAGCQTVTTANDPFAPIPQAGVEPRVYRTVDGRVFATEAERSAYLRGTRAAQRERELIELERLRQEQRAGSLASQQEARRRARQQRYERQQAALEQQRREELYRAEQARREARRAEVREARELERLRRQEAERARERAERAARRAERRAAELARQQQFQTGRPSLYDKPPAWVKYEHLRRPGEPLAVFQVRVAEALAKEDRDGGSAADYLRQHPREAK